MASSAYRIDWLSACCTKVLAALKCLLHHNCAMRNSASSLSHWLPSFMASPLQWLTRLHGFPPFMASLLHGVAPAVAESAAKWIRYIALNNSCTLMLAPQPYPNGQNLARGTLENGISNFTHLWVAQYSRYTYDRLNKSGAGGCSTGNWTNCRAYLQVRREVCEKGIVTR